jgi:3-oxoacyl-[acyl-carrier protein] reductase
MDLGLQKRTAVVLGGGGGLGGAIAAALAAEGARVAVADVSASALESVSAAIRTAGGACLPVQWDLSRADEVETRVSMIERELGAIDILVNNTGGPPPSSATGQSAETWSKWFHAMVVPVIAITDRVLPGMRDRKWGRIITSTSSGVVAPIPNLAISNTLRTSLLGWSKSLAREVAADGVTVNVVVPGRIATSRTQFLDDQRAQREAKSIDEVRAESTKTIPVGRYGDPEEYAAAVAFLASAKASYITGSSLRIDGGVLASI